MLPFVLLLGLVLFLGVHSLRIVAEPWRTRVLAQRGGEKRWKLGYTLMSLAGFALIVWGYGLARQQPMPLWEPPTFMRHVAALLMLPSFVLLAAAYVPGNRLKARLHHPMVISVKVWAFAHLLSNGTLADVLLFGGFLLWAVFSLRAARRRDRSQRIRYGGDSAAATLATLVLGLGAWAGFAFWAHAWLIGVRPLG
ncbi:NnrU family protein [uncultured Methylibium sp.]|uniref:NnrU family protein n=1 Tax=uncultured Methylibium sp. TaxID=381093 RepID=UPI0025E74A81|nr:NnrU family protein [uncultured Methylibium sp.]